MLGRRRVSVDNADVRTRLERRDKIVPLRSRFSQPNCHLRTDISKIGTAGIILLVSASLAYGQFFTYSEWERLPEELREVYLAGAFDTVVGVTEAEDPWGLKKSLHYRQCIRDSHMTLKELSQNVITFAQAKPELRGTWVVAALLLYLQSLCGLVPK